MPEELDDRALSDRTIGALVDAGIDGLETLLSMDKQALKALPGIGRAAMREIDAFRAQHLGREREKS